MNSKQGIRILLFIILITVIPSCRSGEKAVGTPLPARSLWQGNWNSNTHDGSSGTVTALFPDPLPLNTPFPVEATISYISSSRFVVKTVATAMTGYYTEDAGSPQERRLQFRGTITDTDQTIRYEARPNRTLTEFRGEYSSEKPDDRGTFFIRKSGSAP
jgi:hypothetical protein